MNGVDRLGQILTTNSVLRKSMKWWKTMVYHLINMAVVNGFILFKEHQGEFLFYLVAFIFFSGNSCDLVLFFSERTLISW